MCCMHVATRSYSVCIRYCHTAWDCMNVHYYLATITAFIDLLDDSILRREIKTIRVCMVKVFRQEKY